MGLRVCRLNVQEGYLFLVSNFKSRGPYQRLPWFPCPSKGGLQIAPPSDPAPGSNHLAQACSFLTLTGQKPEFGPLLDLQFP